MLTGTILRRQLALNDLTWVEAQEELNHRPVGLLPIGAIEAHGPHLPLNTDIIIAEAMARRASELLASRNVTSITLPTIPYTVSFAGTSFSGTTPVEQDVFQEYLLSVLIGASAQGYRAIICCNAHLEPGHVDAIMSACDIAESRCGIPVRCPDQRAASHAKRLGEEFQAGSRHAGAYETSIVLYTRPDVVRMDHLDNLEPVWIDLPARLREGATTFLDAGSRLGYFGDPRSATADFGKHLLDQLGDMIVECFLDADVG
jgi:creatinine amidohydrolase